MALLDSVGPGHAEKSWGGPVEGCFFTVGPDGWTFSSIDVWAIDVAQQKGTNLALPNGINQMLIPFPVTMYVRFMAK